MNTYSILCVFAVWALTTTASYGQYDALTPGSAEAERALRQYEQGRGHTREEAAKQQKKAGAPKNNLRTTAYDDFKEPYRTQFIEKWNEAVREAKERVASAQRELARAARDPRGYNPRSPTGREIIGQARTSLKDAKEKLKQLEINDPPFIVIPGSKSGLPYEPRDWGVGDTGIMGTNVEVVQVVSKDKVLISVDGPLRNSRSRLIMLSGFPTEGMTDGSVQTISEPIKIIGTTTYTTVGGSTNTVLTAAKAKPFDREAYINSLKRAKP